MRQVMQSSVRNLIDKHLGDGESFDTIVDRFRNSLIVHALSKTQGNISQAALLLKIHRNNVDRWMKKFNISAEEFYEGNHSQSVESDTVQGGLESQGSKL